MIRSKERTAIIRSLAAGVVPSVGLQHIQVGRKEEVEAVISDLKQVEDGTSSVRFIIGNFGSGKTFFLNLISNVALKRKFAVLRADITTERRLHGSGGKARGLYSELLKNLSTTARPDGGALPSLVERWVGDLDHEIKSSDGTEDDVQTEIEKQLSQLRSLVNGYDFAKVLSRYYKGFQQQNDNLQQAALRWLRAEYSTKTEAREDLGVRSIIDDADFYDSLKLLAAFVRIAGYRGLLICLDELVVLSHRLNHTLARNNNYETILTILNDALQGTTEGLAFLFAGTEECLEDRRRGLFSYEALETRLASNRFASSSMRDLTGPVIKLESLTPEDCYVLLHNIRHVFASGEEKQYLIPDEGIASYLQHCQQRMGASYYQTPRETVKDFTGLLQILEQHPDQSWQSLLGQFHQPETQKPSAGNHSRSDDLSEFRL